MAKEVRFFGEAIAFVPKMCYNDATQRDSDKFHPFYYIKGNVTNGRTEKCGEKGKLLTNCKFKSGFVDNGDLLCYNSV